MSRMPRRLRAVVLIGGALLAASVVSLGYLRPAPHVAAKASDVTAVQAEIIDATVIGRTDGGYYYAWTRDVGHSGGHAGS